MKYGLILIFISIFLSCTSRGDKSFKRVKVDAYYRQSGVTKYFLPVTKDQLISYNEGLCRRTKTIKYLDVKSIMDEFEFSYLDSLQLQYSFNTSLRSAVKYLGKSPTLKEEEQIFFKAMDRVRAGQKVFKRPSFKRVNIVWIDSFLFGKNKSKLVSLMQSDVMNLGRPLLFSMCLTRGQIKSRFKKMGLTTEGSRILSFEMLSKFLSNGEEQDKETLNFNLIKKTNQNFYFYYTGKKPQSVYGNVKYKRY